MSASSHGDQVLHLTNQELLCQVGSFCIIAFFQQLLEVTQLSLHCNAILASRWRQAPLQLLHLCHIRGNVSSQGSAFTATSSINMAIQNVTECKVSLADHRSHETESIMKKGMIVHIIKAALEVAYYPVSLWCVHCMWVCVTCCLCICASMSVSCCGLLRSLQQNAFPGPSFKSLSWRVCCTVTCYAFQCNSSSQSYHRNDHMVSQQRLSAHGQTRVSTHAKPALVICR